MTSPARLLPLITVAAWTATLALPILDSGESKGPRIMVSSTGGYPFDLTEAQPIFLVAWIAVLGCAATVWMLRSLTWWSVVAMSVALLLGALLIMTLANPPSLVWDGVGGQGYPTGGNAIAKPMAGALVWVMGIGALFAAGVFGLRERTRQVDNG